MTLKDKFNNLVPIEFGGMQEPLLSDCEKIAEEFAIEFAEWCVKNELFYAIQYRRIKTSELLKIFKKEKGYE
jgi:hypothetical protein